MNTGKAMIFAAGFGTRLKPLTDNMPKALVPVCGKPLLRIVIDKLVSCGINDIVVNVHHFAGMIEDYLSAHPVPGTSITVSDERDMLMDTGGGILHAESLLGDGQFLVHNVDILSDLDLRWLDGQVKDNAVATLAVSDRKTSRYLLFNDDMRLVGWTNAATGEVRSPYRGLDPGRCRRYAFSGIHILSHEIFDAFRKKGFSGKFSITDFYIRAAAEYPIYGIVPEHLNLIDAGKPETLARAREILENGRAS